MSISEKAKEDIPEKHPIDLLVVGRLDYKDRLGESPDNLGYVLSGYVYNDKNTHGRHPFKNDTQIRTSLVTKEEIGEDGYKYVHTLNSVYRIIK